MLDIIYAVLITKPGCHIMEFPVRFEAGIMLNREKASLLSSWQNDFLNFW